VRIQARKVRSAARESRKSAFGLISIGASMFCLQCMFRQLSAGAHRSLLLPFTYFPNWRLLGSVETKILVAGEFVEGSGAKHRTSFHSKMSEAGPWFSRRRDDNGWSRLVVSCGTQAQWRAVMSDRDRCEAIDPTGRDKDEAAHPTVRDKTNEEVAQGEIYGTLLPPARQLSSRAADKRCAFVPGAKEIAAPL
jgi:hypothetical protein